MRKLKIISSCCLLFSVANIQAQVINHRDFRYQNVIGQTTDFTCGPAALEGAYMPIEVHKFFM